MHTHISYEYGVRVCKHDRDKVCDHQNDDNVHFSQSAWKAKTVTARTWLLLESVAIVYYGGQLLYTLL